MSDIEIEVDKILSRVYGKTDDSREVLLRFAQGLSLADVAGVRESCELKRVGVGYAVNALKRCREQRSRHGGEASYQAERNQ